MNFIVHDISIKTTTIKKIRIDILVSYILCRRKERRLPSLFNYRTNKSCGNKFMLLIYLRQRPLKPVRKENEEDS